MMDMVSIIIPVYNVKDYLEDCMESVLAQTYKNIEILLVDDGSIDGSGSLCDEWAAKDSRVKVIHKENGGQSSARNRGLDEAKGQWIMFVDSDDMMAIDIVECLMNVIGENDIAMCDRQDFVDVLCPVQDSGKTVRYDSRTALEMMYSNNQIIVVWAKLYRKSLFETFRFREGIIYEDEDALPQLIWAAGGLVHLHEAKYYYRIRPGSTMTSAFSRKRLDIIGVCQRRIALFEQWGLTELRETAVKDYYLHLKRLEKQTQMPCSEKEHVYVLEMKEHWREYGVRFSLIERLKMLR